MKKRLDSALVERGIVSAREKAKAVIMAGQVYVNNQKADKAGMDVSDEDKIEFRGEALKYVSRGGLKLEKAMEAFSLEGALRGKVCMDVGASTGGFTDCMLQNGAAKVYAIDVGYGQLAWTLRNDPRVINLERTNVRYVTREQVPDPVDFSSIDVSFISLTLVLPVVCQLLGPQGQIVCLVKPQFEAGREKVGKKGVVRDPRVHLEVIQKVVGFAHAAGVGVRGLTFSPVKGPEGNIEYLLYLDKGVSHCLVSPEEIAACVESSHSRLDRNDRERGQEIKV